LRKVFKKLALGVDFDDKAVHQKALVSISLWEEISKYTDFEGVVCQVSPLSILAEWKEVLVPQHFHGLLFGLQECG
jgi:hypothetical protein